MTQAAGATELHEWVENFGEHDFEGVLICTNPLGQWDEGAALRAFQTFQWADATTEGNDSSFVHNATGVVVRFEGAALAIECGQGTLEDALSDLFDVLYSLNWRDVELYHPGPAAASNAFLGDIGRAIPARYADFDIHLAKVERAVSEFAEGAALVARGRQLLGGEAADEGATLLGEMQTLNMRTMGGMMASPDRAEPPVAVVGQGGGILLDEGDDDGSYDEVLVVGIRSAPALVASASGAPASYPVDDDESPRLYELPVAGGDDVADISFANDELEPETIGRVLVEQHQPQPQQPAHRADSTDEVTARVAPVLPLVEAVAMPLKPPIQPTFTLKDAATSAPMLAARTPSDIGFEAAGSVVVVGRSAICFDLPANPMTDDDVRAVADERGVGSKDVVHIHPGALAESLRWDVLGEVVPSHPFFAEKLVDAMFAGARDSVLIATAILALKQGEPRAQLRDLLALARQDDSAQSMADVVRRIGALALAPAGQAFVDLIPAGAVDDAAENLNVDYSFTVMEILQSPATRLYVVHVDQLDGPFILWIVDLLRFVATNYAATKRYSCAVEEVADVGEVHPSAPSSVEAITAVAGEMAAILGKLGEMGIKF